MRRTTRRIALTVCLATLVGLTGVPAVEPLRVPGRTNADRLRVRSEPSLSAEVVDTLAIGSVLEVLEATPEEMVIGEMSARWYRVGPLPGGPDVHGWAYGHFIDVAPERMLGLAIWHGDWGMVDDLLASGVSVNERITEDGEILNLYEEYTYSSFALVEAVRAGRKDIAARLIAVGAHPDAAYSYGEPGGGERKPALVVAIESGDLELVLLVISARPDLNQMASVFGGGEGRSEMSPLAAAVRTGDLFLVAYLLLKGADPSVGEVSDTLSQGKTERSPAEIANELGFPRIALLILAATEN